MKIGHEQRPLLRQRRAVSIGAVGALVAAALVFTTTPNNSSNASTNVTIQVQPAVSLMDQPLSIRISGLQPETLVTLAMSAIDGEGVRWTSTARFKTNNQGDLNPATASSIGGSYTGVEAMGLVSSMSPTRVDTAYFPWNGSAELAIRLSVEIAGQFVRSTLFERRGYIPGVTVRTETLARNGFIGQFWAPPGGGRRTAVLVFGGSEGGFDGELIGAGLASAGYPVLNIAYFKEPGLPQQALDIPLEYFARALNWLGHRPDVQSNQIYVDGNSLGGAAALLLGVHFPNLVHGVVATSADDVVFCSIPSCSGPAWTLNRKPIPYTLLNNPNAKGNPAAVIPVEDIRGPVFLACGVHDQVWRTSCAQANAIMSRLASHHDRYKHVSYEYADAGHGVGGLIPYEPGTGAANIAGTYPQANQVADASLWPRLLAWLPRPFANS